jgi:hypothetical protein
VYQSRLKGSLVSRGYRVLPEGSTETINEQMMRRSATTDAIYLTKGKCMMNQKEAVYTTIMNLFNVEGEGAVSLDREQRADVIAVLVEGFKSKKIAYAGELPDDKGLNSYCSGLLSNWLRKDSRLNGGVKYEAKNPGSRTGSSDPQIKALRALIKTQSDPSKIAEIQSFIDKRLAEIAPATKQVSVNVEDLPAELRAKYGF